MVTINGHKYSIQEIVIISWLGGSAALLIVIGICWGVGLLLREAYRNRVSWVRDRGPRKERQKAERIRLEEQQLQRLQRRREELQYEMFP